MYPAFLRLESRKVVLVGGGPVAAGKLAPLLEAGARVTVVAPDIRPELERPGVTLVRRGFEDDDLTDAWWVVAAAPPDVNRRVREAAEARCIFVNAVDDPPHATAFAGSVVRRDGVTIAMSTDGRAPALAGLLREALDAWLPRDLDIWLGAADEARRRWRDEGVPMADRRPQLLETLNRLYEKPKAQIPKPKSQGPKPNARARVQVASPEVPVQKSESQVPVAEVSVPKSSPLGFGTWDLGFGISGGLVSLVGAGPGDPELWTVRAVRRLEEADLVLYDALVDVEALRRATSAPCFSVGKRARRDSVPQETINRLMIRAARRGRRVVRLKGGDPFVFGRGGEEALALVEAGVAVEVVPGVTTAVSAAALAGIPVTHRGVASAFLVLAGHSTAAVDHALGAVQPNSVSVVFMMGVGARADLGARLTSRGWRADTPAAIVCAASMPGQWVWTGRLSDLGQAEPPSGEAGVLIIGDVVLVREALTAAAEPRPAVAQAR